MLFTYLILVGSCIDYVEYVPIVLVVERGDHGVHYQFVNGPARLCK